MKKNICIILLQLPVLCCFSQIQLTVTLCENRVNPIGLDFPQPELSWQFQSATRNTMQTAYEIRVAENSSDVAKGANLLWNTGKVATDKSVHVNYGGASLQSAKKYF